jgi:hypothetical protein
MKFEIANLKAEYEPYRSRKNEPYKASNKLFIWPDGESVMDNLFNRHNRPSKVWKEELIPAIIGKLKEVNPEVYEIVHNEEWGWRQKCGCSCPCSPGFIGKKGGQYCITATVKFTEE